MPPVDIKYKEDGSVDLDNSLILPSKDAEKRNKIARKKKEQRSRKKRKTKIEDLIIPKTPKEPNNKKIIVLGAVILTTGLILAAVCLRPELSYILLAMP